MIYRTPYTSRDHPDRLWARKHLLRPPTPIHLHFAFEGRSISAKCGTLHVSFANKLFPELSEFRHFHWSPQSQDMNILEHIWKLLFRRDLHPLALMNFVGFPEIFMMLITSKIPTDISRVHTMSCCDSSAYFWKAIYNIS